jgi:serine/threonine-protein kinase
VPEQLDDLVLWATAKEPDERPSDARVMLERLRTAEIEIVSARPAGTMTQRTMVLPPDTFDADLDQAQTQVLEARRRTDPVPTIAPEASAATTVYGSAVAAPGGPKPPQGPKEKLARKSSSRRKRGFWIFALVLVVAMALGGGAWYFGAGPGAMTTIPDVAGQQPDSAIATLTALGLEATQQPQSSPTVAAGTVIGTDPGATEQVRNGSAVTVLVSSGPAMLPVPDLSGLDETAAKAALQQAGFTVTDSQTQFNADVGAGGVLAALGADGNALGAEYGEQQPVTLVVSLGAVPDVVGQTLDEAKATLAAVGLSGVDGSQDFSDTVPEGQVYEVGYSADPMVPGAEVTLNVSRGPAPVAVPDVLGQTWDKAKQTLIDAGFSLDYNFGADLAPGLVRVTGTNPSPGTMVPKGSTLTVTFV